MKITKKLMTFLLACTMLATITGCKDTNNDSDKIESNNGTVTDTADEELDPFDSPIKKEIVIEIDTQTVSLGKNHSAAITVDGSLYMWGDNSNGQLGNGTKEQSDTPIKIMDDIASVSLGDNTSAAITTDGDLYMWGNNTSGELGTGKTTFGSSTPQKIMDNVRSVSLGNSHSAAITTDGALYVWGSNRYGQVGCGETGEDVTTPQKIMDNVRYISLKAHSSAAIKTDGTLYMWGEASNSRFSEASTSNNNQFRPLEIMRPVSTVCLGGFYNAVIQRGTLYMWGSNEYGQFGNGDTRGNYQLTKIMDNVASVSLSSNFSIYPKHSAIITKDGTLYMCGNGKYGQLGNGETKEKNPDPIRIMDNVTSVSLGENHSAAVTKDGYLYTWGSGSRGELGNGETNEKNSIPIMIMDNIAESGVKEFHREVESTAGVEAYVDVLENEYESSAQFALTYIDEDSIPELLVFKDGSHMASAEIYTYKNDQAVFIGNAGSYGSISYLPGQNIIYIGDMHMGYTTDNFYCIKDGSIERIASFFNDEFTMTDSATFKVNDKEVSEEEYNTELNKMKDNKEFTNAGYGNKTSNTISQGISLIRENYKEIIID